MRLLSLIIAAATALSMQAGIPTDSTTTVAEKPLRPVTSAYMFEAGSAKLRDTYLTPLEYKGWDVALSYERFQAMGFDPQRWIMRLGGSLRLERVDNPAGTTSMWSVGLSPSWSMMRRWRPAANLTVAVGPEVGVDIGARYLMRNSNNPASVQASATVGVSAMATYNLQIGRLPITLRYQPSMPLAGVFFSPDYDELYYEIWLGNHSGLCHFAWPGSLFRLDNLVTADLRFGATNLRLGYRCEVYSSKASDIVTRHITHAFVIGVTTEWLSLSAGSRRSPDAATISAFY